MKSGMGYAHGRCRKIPRRREAACALRRRRRRLLISGGNGGDFAVGLFDSSSAFGC